MNRHNFYVDEQRMTMLRRLAEVEGGNISLLLREAIDKLIADRLNTPRPSPAERNAQFEAFLGRFAGSGPNRSLEEIDALVDEADTERKRRRKRHRKIVAAQ
jgi:hypothetical protein